MIGLGLAIPTLASQGSPLSRLYSIILGAFSGGAPGWLYDDSNMSTLYQDASTPVTALEQPVGLQLDLSQGLVRTQQITNIADRTFTSNTGFWSLDAGVTISGGSANWAALSAYAFGRSGFLAAGKTYLVTVTVLSIASGGLKIYAPTALGTLPTYTTPGTYTALVTAASASSFGVISVGTTTAQVSFVSCELLAGNHRYQPTSANRPTWSARYNNITKSEDVSNPAWTKYGVTPTVASGITLPSKYAAASLITSNAGAGNHYSAQVGSTVYPAGTQITLTQWVQRGNQQYYFLGDQSDAVYHNATFDLIAGTVSGQTNAVGSIVPNGNGFDLKTTFTLTNATSTSVQFGVSMIANVPSVGPYTAAGTETVYVTGIDVRPTNQATGLIPTYQRVNTATDYDSVGFPAGLRWNGSNSWMQNASTDFSGTNKVSVFVGVRVTRSSTTGFVVETSTNSGSNNGAFYVDAPDHVNAAADFGFQVRGTAAAYADTASGSAVAPVTKVLSVQMNLAGITLATALINRLNGVVDQTVLGGSIPGGGNFGNYPAYFGARAGSSLFFNGLTFSSIAIGIELSASQIAAFEAWTNSRTKAYA